MFFPQLAFCSHPKKITDATLAWFGMTNVSIAQFGPVWPSLDNFNTGSVRAFDLLFFLTMLPPNL
jgi:hypothetical protein